MPTNTATVAALVPQDVPPDRQCVSNLSEIVQGVSDFTQVLLTNTAQQGGTGNSVADQALQLAQTALAAAQAAQASIPQRRALASPQAIPEGDSNLSISWTPDMPDANYEVNGTFYAPAGLSAYGAQFYVVDATRTVSGCTLRLCNVPNLSAGLTSSFSWSVTQLAVAAA